MKPEVSIGVGLATAAMVGAVYMNATPTLADARVARPRDMDLAASRKTAAWTAGGLVAAVSLISKDPTVFILGGGMVVVLDWWYRHANEVDSTTGKATVGAAIAAAGAPTQESAPQDYGYADDLVSVGF